MPTGLLDALGYFGGTLDKLGGRAVRGLLGGHPDELASFVPFSDRLGITDPNRIVSGRALLDHLGVTDPGDDGLGGHLLGMGAEMALDPTNLVGAGIGQWARTLPKWTGRAAKAAKVGATALPEGAVAAMRLPPFPDEGKLLNQAADAVGPRYATTGDQLLDTLHDIVSRGVRAPRILGELRGSPLLERIAEEFPTDVQGLGVGSNTVALHSPSTGGVYTLGRVFAPNDFDARGGALGRYLSQGVLQPSRTALFGNHVFEALPRVYPLMHEPGVGEVSLQAAQDLALRLDQSFISRSGAKLREASDRVGSFLNRSLAGDGLHMWDSHPYNLALTREGAILTHDAGAVKPTVGESPFLEPYKELWQGARPDAVLRAGGPEAIRRATIAGFDTAGSPDLFPQGFPLPQAAPFLDTVAEERKLLAILLRAGQGVPTPIPAPLASPARASGMPSWFAADNPIPAGWGEIAGDTRPIRKGAPPLPGDIGLSMRFGDLRRGVRKLKGDPGDFFKNHPSVGGFYIPKQNAFAVRRGAPPTIRRHEPGHAIVDQAVKRGAAAVRQLPLAWQPAAWAKLFAQRTGMGHSAGRWLDEMGQFGTQNRGLPAQVAGTARFLASPYYANAYAQRLGLNNPLLYRLMLMPPRLAANAFPLAVSQSALGALAREADQ